jgi:hypothetical protein
MYKFNVFKKFEPLIDFQKKIYILIFSFVNIFHPLNKTWHTKFIFNLKFFFSINAYLKLSTSWKFHQRYRKHFVQISFKIPPFKFYRIHINKIQVKLTVQIWNRNHIEMHMRPPKSVCRKMWKLHKILSENSTKCFYRIFNHHPLDEEWQHLHYSCVKFTENF